MVAVPTACVADLLGCFGCKCSGAQVLFAWAFAICNGSSALWGLAVKIVSSAADVFVPECGVLVTWVHLLVHFAKFGWLFANPCSSSFVVI